jgi:hypothetical protein
MISNTFKMAATGTSFHDDTITASVNDLIQIVGEPVYDTNDGEDKVNFEWNLELGDGTVFTIYDWKEYRSLSRDEMIEWHIGGHSRISTIKACDELQKLLRNL